MEITKYDRFDIAILRELQKDGRATIIDLSDRVGLSPSPVARRVQNLEAAGLITGYAALLDETKLGFGVSVFVSVQLDKQVDGALATFEAAILQFPEVVDCWLMTGNRDYMLRIATSGLAEFERFLVGTLTQVQGVSSIESSIPLRRVKSGLARTPWKEITRISGIFKITEFSATIDFIMVQLPATRCDPRGKTAGFDAVECHWTFLFEAKRVSATHGETGQKMLSLNTRAWRYQRPEFGLTAMPGRRVEASTAIDEAISYARSINAGKVRIMAGLSERNNAKDCFS
jgi:Lrp/AsnC family leucine-responsive transcriptional regulator